MTSNPSSTEPEPAQNLAPGAIVAGKYRVTSTVGKGAMGAVYKAEHVDSGQKVAVKFILAAEGHKDAMARFTQKAGSPAAAAPTVAKPKCDKNVDELRVKRAEAKADDAVAAEKAANYGLAAKIWADALALAPEKTGWILRLARADHLAGNNDAALKGYDKYLALPPQQAPDQPDAARWRAEIAPKTFDEVPVPKDPVAVVAVAKPADGSGRGMAWAVVGGGAAVGLAGLGLYVATQGDVSSYDAKIAAGAGGKVTAWSLQEANAERDRLNRRIYASWGLAGAGVVVVGVGAWLLVRAPTVSVAVTPQGFVVAGRF